MHPGHIVAAAAKLSHAGMLRAGQGHPVHEPTVSGGPIGAPGGEKEHAAVLVGPLCAFLAADEPVAAALLARMDEYAQRRSGRPRPTTAAAAAASGAVTSAAYYGGDAMLASPSMAGGPMPSTPFAQAAGIMHTMPGMGGYPPTALPGPYAHPPTIPGSSASASYVPGTPLASLGTPLAAQGGMYGPSAGMLALPTPTSAGLTGGPAPTPMTASVGDFLRGHASPQEKENVLALLATLQDLQRRLGIAPAAPQGPRGAPLAEGSDSLVLDLGPRLHVGIRFYVS